MNQDEHSEVSISWLLECAATKAPSHLEDMELVSVVPIKTLESALRLSQERYGTKLVVQMVRVLREHITRRNDEVVFETLKVQDASAKFSKVLKKARSGQYQLVGGFQKGSDPVVVMSLEQFAQVMGGAMEDQSVVDLMPVRPPLNEPLHLAAGDQPTSSPVTL